MKYSTVIFDLDGTLLDTSEGIMAGARYTTEKMRGPELTIHQLKSFIGPPIIDSFIRECGFNENEAREAVELYRQRYKKNGLYEAKQYDGVKELLITLKENDYWTAVATLKRDDFAKEILRHFELSEHFNVIKGIDERDSYSKSDIIQQCLKELNQNDLSKVVLIGDSIYDSIGAELAGIDFIAVTYGFGFRNKQDGNNCKNIYVADTVDDIKKYLNL